MLERPDLAGVDPALVAYIEALEEALASQQAADEAAARADAPSEPSEPPTTVNVITISAAGLGKRTPRHLYLRQRRGGMGVFDLDLPADDPPLFLLMADERAGLILVTNHARAFRIPVSEVTETEVRGRGEPLLDRLPLRADERLALVFPDTPVDGGSFAVVVSERGQVRRIGKQYLGLNLQAGTVLYDVRDGGAPAAICWSSGNQDLFIVTRTGQGIRFAERLVPVRGCLGLRVDPSDRVVGVASTSEGGGVFLLSQEGKGTVRQMSGFGANKAPGAGGKTAMKADVIVGAVPVTEQSDIFVISRLGKIIRFRPREVPAKEGLVQGVNCMSLRADECVAMTTAIVPEADLA